MNVTEILSGQPDGTGATVETVYAKVVPLFAVYRTSERVMVHFADEGIQSPSGEPLGREQRLAISNLAPVRGEINGLVDDWRDTAVPSYRSKAGRFDRRVADALVVALQGDPANAATLLITIKADVLEERMSIARSLYLQVASVVTLATIALMALLGSPWYARAIFEFSGLTRVFWFGAGIGALGAMFSIALAIRDRTIGSELQWRDNFADAALRIAIGAISAAVLFSALLSDIVSVKLGNTILVPGGPCPVPSICGQFSQSFVLYQPLAVVLAFVAGFSERLASDLLSRTVGGALASASATAASRPPASGLATPNEADPLGRSRLPAGQPGSDAGVPEVPPDDDLDDNCGCEAEPEINEITEDVELPEAAGGVEGSPPGPR